MDSRKSRANGEFKDCWMTVGVSRPMPLSQASQCAEDLQVLKIKKKL